MYLVSEGIAREPDPTSQNRVNNRSTAHISRLYKTIETDGPHNEGPIPVQYATERENRDHDKNPEACC